jgi:hypothetical protein
MPYDFHCRMPMAARLLSRTSATMTWPVMDTTGIPYNVGGGGKAVERRELIISWDRMAEPAGLL